jgi:hypothetical protein
MVLTVGAASGLIAVTAVGLVLLWPGRGSSSALQAACPPVDHGCRPLAAQGGVIDVGGTRYLIGSPSGPALVVMGRWDCRAALPAVLDTDHGTVWVFSRWPTRGSTAAARLVRTVTSAAGLAVLADRSGCDQLEVDRVGRAPVVLRPQP